jgi:energy-converting hydrogenase Eha subunit C
MSPHPHLDAASSPGESSALATVFLCVVAVGLAAASTRLPSTRVPVVLFLICSGMVTRAVGRSFIDVPVLGSIARPASDVCLSLIGLLIGSHLNKETLASLGIRMCWYLLAFFAATYATVSVVASLLFPSLAGYAPFVASIALERSSPEALAGITAAKAKGPFAATTLLTSAAMDCAALVAFVSCNAVLAGSGSAVGTLGHVAFWTAVAAVIAWAAIVGTMRTSHSAVVAVLVGASLLTALHRFLHFELLLAALIAGSVLNYTSHHPITAVLEENAQPVHIVLFGLSGLRIDVVGMAGHLSPLAVVALYLARLGGMWIGTAGAARALGYQHPNQRCLALVTQLAIALSLVTRLHDAFPEAAPLADATAGMILLNLATGPMLLQFALRAVGEADSAPPTRTTEASGSLGSTTTALPNDKNTRAVDVEARP